jgi:hypothetical protein
MEDCKPAQHLHSLQDKTLLPHDSNAIAGKKARNIFAKSKVWFSTREYAFPAADTDTALTQVGDRPAAPTSAAWPVKLSQRRFVVAVILPSYASLPRADQVHHLHQSFSFLPITDVYVSHMCQNRKQLVQLVFSMAITLRTG